MCVRFITIVLGVLLANQVWAGSVNYEYDDLGRLTELSYEDGAYVIYTYDDVGNRITEEQFVPSNESCNLDIDDNRRADALSDGLLILRYLLGFRGPGLIDGVVPSDANRRTAQEIEDYLAQCVSSGALDIDLNGRADALTDGLLILRYLLGFRGQPLIEGAVAPGAGRSTAPEIETYLNGLLP